MGRHVLWKVPPQELWGMAGPCAWGTHGTVPQSQEGPQPHHRARGTGLLSFLLPTQVQNVEVSADTQRLASRGTVPQGDTAWDGTGGNRLDLLSDKLYEHCHYAVST